MEECKDSLEDAQIFSTLNCNNDYWQNETDEEAKEKTAFNFHYGLYQLIRKLFGMKSAPATTQRMMDVMLPKIKWQYVLVFSDDIVIFSKKPNDPIKHTRSVLRVLKVIGVTVKLKMGALFTNGTNYLGHVIKLGNLKFSKPHNRCHLKVKSTNYHDRAEVVPWTL